jgi:hypothetical protein
MFFILRMVFWIAVVALLLPASPERPGLSASSGATASSLTERAVSAAVSYCTTNPEKCAAGLEGAHRLGDLLTGKAGSNGNLAPSASLQHLVALPPPRPAIP